jgi:hypothetical protein
MTVHVNDQNRYKVADKIAVQTADPVKDSPPENTADQTAKTAEIQLIK